MSTPADFQEQSPPAASGGNESREENAATFEYEGWQIAILVDKTADDGFASAHADLFDQRTHVCRLMLAGKVNDMTRTVGMLYAKAKGYIDARRR